MKIAIVTIGNELVSGRTLDTNTALIARLTGQMNWPVVASLAVGDDERAIAEVLKFALERADAIIVTGGLGPTADDITTAAVARALNLPLYMDEQVLASLKTLFENFHLKWTENNTKQAVFPTGAEILPNPIGTAAGFSLRYGQRWIFVIPGVPREAERMMREQVIPRLQRAVTEEQSYPMTRTIKTFGLSEAAVDEMLRDVDFAALDIRVGFYPHFPENHLTLTTAGRTEGEAKEKIARAEEIISSRLSPYIFAYDNETLEGNIYTLMTARNWTLAIAESCTGGLIADRITDVSGSSAYFERGYVTYSNHAKTALLGVPADIIVKFGAVSEETARLMAEGVQTKAGTHLGLAITGILGPTGGSESKPIGTVYMALADGGRTFCRRYNFRWDRRRNKIIAAETALMMLLRYLKGQSDDTP